MTPTEPRASHRVLLVDDDAAVCSMMTQGLERKGFEVVGADCVTAALRQIATESFDVLISDLHMPDPGDDRSLSHAPFPTEYADHACQRLPRRAKRDGSNPTGGGRNRRKTIRDCTAHRTCRGKNAPPQTYETIGERESGRDTAAIRSQYCRRLVGTGETEL
jgi:CheY-like chemotaxis protein